ncbi:MAG: ATPase [Kiritimatiellae bacterium]|nr:ATPase [Kiritimatiellia bacterium]
MAEELQHLIERIQREAVDTGEKQAADLVAKAKRQAAEIVAEAEKQAKEYREKAERDAEQFTARSQQTLRQASRDLLITVGRGVENIVGRLAKEASDASLTYETVQTMLEKLVESYWSRPDREHRIEVMVNPKDQERLVAFFKSKYREQLGKGLEVKGDERILKGFNVKLANGRIEHSFTNEAIAEALSSFLRPHLAAIVYQAARENG